MTLTQHLAFTAAASALLAPFCTPAEIGVFAVGSVLIDVDHYFVYVQRTSRLDLRGMFRYFEELEPVQHTVPYFGLCVFHTFDVLLIICALAFVHRLWGFLAAGWLFHFLLDLYHLRRNRVLFIRAYFLVEHFIRRRAPGYPWY